MVCDGTGIPLGCVITGANCHDSPLLEPTLATLPRLGPLPEVMTVHLDAGDDSQKTRDLLTDVDMTGIISCKGTPLQAGRRWVIERLNSWHNRGFKKLLICTEKRTCVILALIALANAIIITRRLIRQAWTHYRWDTRPNRHP